MSFVSSGEMTSTPRSAGEGLCGAIAITDEAFKAAFRNHPGGVAIVTADAGDGPTGMTVTSLISANVSPHLMAFSVSAVSSAGPALRRSETVVVHLLRDTDLPLAQLFATSGVDRFADTSLWSRLESGEPFLHGVDVWIRGRVVDSMRMGDSALLAIEALEASPELGSNVASGTPLLYNNRSWHTPRELQLT